MERVGLRVSLAKAHTGALCVKAKEDVGGEWKELRINQRIGATVYWVNGDPVEYITSANIHRRHLMAETKRDLIAKLLKEHPERSDRATAELVKVDNKTVAAVRRHEEDVGRIPHVEKRVDTKGRKQPAGKPPKPEAAPEPKPALSKSRIEPHETCIMRVRAMILDEWLPQIPQAQWVEFVRELLDEIEDIKGVIEKRTGPITIKREQHADKAKAEALN
jgi:hypothetical protein